MKSKTWIGSILFSVALGLSTHASAVPTYCIPINIDGLSVSDVTFNGASADNCFGVVSGNDDASNLGFSGFTFLVSDDNPGSGLDSGTVNGVTFTLGAAAGTSGDWTLSWTGALPITMDLVAVLKGGRSFAAYLFDDLSFATSPSSGTGTFTIQFLNGGENIPDLSHLALYWGDFQKVVTTPVDEPGTLALLALTGLALIGISRRRVRARIR